MNYLSCSNSTQILEVHGAHVLTVIFKKTEKKILMGKKKMHLIDLLSVRPCSGCNQVVISPLFLEHHWFTTVDFLAKLILTCLDNRVQHFTTTHLKCISLYSEIIYYYIIYIYIYIYIHTYI